MQQRARSGHFRTTGSTPRSVARFDAFARGRGRRDLAVRLRLHDVRSLHLQTDPDRTAAGVPGDIRSDRSGQWLESSILHLVEEAASGRVGSEAMLAKLSEALFVDTLRRYVSGMPEQQTGWLAGARDPIVGRSLGLLHSRMAHPWTIADLAGEVGISRSALVERFTQYLSEPPMTYLTRWRLRWRHGRSNVHREVWRRLPAEVGYESEAAFNRAFKREFGSRPGGTAGIIGTRVRRGAALTTPSC